MVKKENINLVYIRKKLDEISIAINYEKGLTPDEKLEFKQKLTKPIVYCLDRNFKVAREGKHYVAK